jgi:hypothetical protein
LHPTPVFSGVFFLSEPQCTVYYFHRRARSLLFHLVPPAQPCLAYGTSHHFIHQAAAAYSASFFLLLRKIVPSSDGTAGDFSAY